MQMKNIVHHTCDNDGDDYDGVEDEGDDDDSGGDDVCPKQLITVVSPITPPEASTHTQQSVINIRGGNNLWVAHGLLEILPLFCNFSEILVQLLRVQIGRCVNLGENNDLLF